MTLHKLVEKINQRKSDYARSLIESSMDPLIIISIDGKIMDMNEALTTITEETRESLTGTDFFDYFSEPQKAREIYKEVFVKEHVTDAPLTICSSNGKLTNILFNGSVYKDELGKVQGGVIVARYINVQKLKVKYSFSLQETSLDMKYLTWFCNLNSLSHNSEKQ